jgi:hypothetical protein
MLGPMLVPGGMPGAANADTWVMKDTLRPNGHDRPMAAKRTDARQCGATRAGRTFSDNDAPNMQQCMLARGWALDHIIPDPPSRHARRPADSGYEPPPQIDNSMADQHRQIQEKNDSQQMINNQQMLNDQNFQQQQQQMINDMNR